MITQDVRDVFEILNVIRRFGQSGKLQSVPNVLEKKRAYHLGFLHTNINGLLKVYDGKESKLRRKA